MKTFSLLTLRKAKFGVYNDNVMIAATEPGLIGTGESFTLPRRHTLARRLFFCCCPRESSAFAGIWRLFYVPLSESPVRKRLLLLAPFRAYYL